jgi:hypothetical protein
LSVPTSIVFPCFLVNFILHLKWQNYEMTVCVFLLILQHNLQVFLFNFAVTSTFIVAPFPYNSEFRLKIPLSAIIGKIIRMKTHTRVSSTHNILTLSIIIKLCKSKSSYISTSMHIPIQSSKFCWQLQE